MIKMSTWNCRGITNKYHELLLFLCNYHIDIILLTETKLAPYMHFHIPGYKVYRSDHPSGRRKGGSAILIRTTIGHDELPAIIEEELQVCQILLHHPTLNELKVASFYSAPENRILRSDLLSLIHELRSCFVIGGDFNSKHPRFGCRTSNPRGRLLNEMIVQYSLDVIYPSEPTYYPDSGSTPDILDFYLCKGITQFMSIARVTKELSSDHYPVLLDIHQTPILLPYHNGLVTYPFDWELYKTKIQELTDLQVPLKTPSDIDSAVAKFTTIIQIAASSASSQSPIVNRSYVHKPSPIIENLLREKRYSRSQWELTRDPRAKVIYNQATRNLKNALKEDRDTADQNKLRSLNAHDGSLWHKTKYLTKEWNDIPPLKTGNRWYCTMKEKADLFAEILEEQFMPNPVTNPQANDEIMAVVEEPLQLSPFSDFFTPGRVRSIIAKLPNKKSPGHDQITDKLLKALPRKGLVFLTQIYNAILRTTHIPHKWKHACIVMIHKPNKNKEDPSSYRPISLLPILAKILERLLLPTLLTHLSHLIPHEQFGFRQNHSCPQQLHRVIDVIQDTFEQKKVCIGAYLDVEKAFDKVYHEGLLCKIKPHLPDTYYRLLQSYLTGRTYSVKCKTYISHSKPINAGVPQGSLIGPLLYLIYAHDIPLPSQATTAIYADDVAILHVEDNFQVAHDTLQDSLRQLHLWSEKWRVKLNAPKSTIVPFTLKRQIYQFTPSYNGQYIPINYTVKYLGLTLDHHLTWGAHINYLVGRIRQRIRQLKPLLHEHSPLSLTTKRLLYLSLIRPIWYYSCGLWGSAAATHVKRIQVTQNRVLRLITNAPWYIRNSMLHNDLDIPMVSDVITEMYGSLIRGMEGHANPVIATIVENPAPPRTQRRLKRKRLQDSIIQVQQ